MAKMIDGEAYKEMILAAAAAVADRVEEVNALNVFPVPDGDTGTNMVKTFGGGLRSVQPDQADVSAYMEQLSQAVLLSARGNSGVIFSQFISGLLFALPLLQEW